MTLDAEIVTHLDDVLKKVTDSDHRSFACCPHTEKNTSEYLTHFFKRHFDSADAPRQFLNPRQVVLTGEKADEYRAIKDDVRQAGNNRFVQDKYWNTRAIMDFHDGKTNMVILHDYSGTAETAAMLRDYFSARSEGRCAAEMRFALNHGSNRLQEDRREFLQKVYSERAALDFVGKNYTVDEAAALYAALFSPSEAVERLEQSHTMTVAAQFIATRHKIDEAWQMYEQAFNPLAAFVRTFAAYGKEAALGYLATHYPSQEAGAMIREALPDDEIWAATETAFKDRIIYQPTPAQDAPATGGGAASVDARIAAYK